MKNLGPLWDLVSKRLFSRSLVGFRGFVPLRCWFHSTILILRRIFRCTRGDRQMSTMAWSNIFTSTNNNKLLSHRPHTFLSYTRLSYTRFVDSILVQISFFVANSEIVYTNFDDFLFLHVFTTSFVRWMISRIKTEPSNEEDIRGYNSSQLNQ